MLRDAIVKEGLPTTLKGALAKIRDEEQDKEQKKDTLSLSTK